MCRNVLLAMSMRIAHIRSLSDCSKYRHPPDEVLSGIAIFCKIASIPKTFILNSDNDNKHQLVIARAHRWVQYKRVRAHSYSSKELKASVLAGQGCEGIMI